MTHQEQGDFYEYGLADPRQGVNLAINVVLQAREKEIDLRAIDDESLEAKGERVYNKAIEAGLLEGSATLLTMLTSGMIRVENGAQLRSRSMFFMMVAWLRACLATVPMLTTGRSGVLLLLRN